MSCGGHDIRDVGKLAADREFACTCFDCGTSVVIASDGFRVIEPQRAGRSAERRRAKAA